MLLLPTSRPACRVGYWLWLRVVLVVVAVAQRRPAQLLSHDLHDGAGAAVLSDPGPLLE